MSNREWMTEASCRGLEPSLFFPESTGIKGKREAELAILICSECGVRIECGEYRKETDSGFGVWAGTMHRSTALGVSQVRGQYRKSRKGAA